MNILKFFAVTIMLSALPVQSKSAQLHIFHSANLHCNDSVMVWSPQNTPERGLPTLFLLHGWGGSWRNWSDRTDIQAVSDKSGFRIICPDGLFDSWYADNCDTTKVQWRKFFWKELWPEMDLLYGLEPDRTFITGLSMGGYGAISVFLDHPERFKGAGSMSGVLSFKYSGGSLERIPHIFGVQTIEEPACAAEEAINRLDEYNNSFREDMEKKMLVITSGAQDRKFVGASKDFADKCSLLGIPHILMISPGRHRWPYWIWALDYHLHWFRDAMESDFETIMDAK